MSMQDKLDLLSLWMGLYIDWYFCKDQIKHIKIKTKYGDFSGISNYSGLVKQVEAAIKYSTILK